MGYFEKFFVLRDKIQDENVYVSKTIDTEQVESWEAYDQYHTKVFMRSGDNFLVYMKVEKFEDIIIEYEDVYGKLLVVSQN